MSGKFSIQKMENVAQWDNILQNSPQDTIFFRDSYLKNLGNPYELWSVKKGLEFRAGFLVLPDQEQERCVLNDLVIYAGIFFVPDAQVQKPAKIYSEQFEITELIISFLTERYKTIEIALTPEFVDIRPFLWYNYNSDDLHNKFKASVRYTSYIDISELAEDKEEEDCELFRKLDVIRQRNIRKARKEGGYIKEERKIEEFIEYYKSLMENQGNIVPEEKLQSMKSLITGLLDSNQARMFVSYNSNNQIGSINTYCYDSRRAYYLFGASNSQTREEYCGTLVFWDAFKSLAKSGIKTVDMEGINSPKRGWFKLSFGGEIKTYYELSYGG